MKTQITTCKGTIIGLLLALWIVAMLAGSGVAQATYRITDLGTLGGDNSIPIWITNKGDVIGVSDTGQFDSFGNPIDHAFRWRKGIMQDFGTLGVSNGIDGTYVEAVSTSAADIGNTFRYDLTSGNWKRSLLLAT